VCPSATAGPLPCCLQTSLLPHMNGRRSTSSSGRADRAQGLVHCRLHRQLIAIMGCGRRNEFIAKPFSVGASCAGSARCWTSPSAPGRAELVEHYPQRRYAALALGLGLAVTAVPRCSSEFHPMASGPSVR